MKYLCDFWWDICYNSYSCSSTGKVFLFSISFMIFLISFVFCSSNMICLDVDILIFILLSIICDYLASWICGLVSVIILENSSPLLLQYFFFSLSLTFGILIMHMLQLLKLFHSSCRFCFFPHLLFLPFVFQCGKFIFTSSHSSICFPWPCPVNW